jgi:hypothetical protein
VSGPSKAKHLDSEAPFIGAFIFAPTHPRYSPSPSVRLFRIGLSFPADRRLSETTYRQCGEMWALTAKAMKCTTGAISATEIRETKKRRHRRLLSRER